MKKFILIAFAAIMGLSATAQDSKWYLGGQLTVGGAKVEDVSATEITVLPEIGYNVSENVSIGVQLGVDWIKVEDDKQTTWQVNPYVRYNYFKSERVNLFVDGGVDLGFGKVADETALQYGVGFRPGVEFCLNEKFSLVAHVGFLGYQGANDNAKAMGSPEKWGLDLSTNNLMFGFYFKF